MRSPASNHASFVTVVGCVVIGIIAFLFNTCFHIK
jgi:hypothetical protein